MLLVVAVFLGLPMKLVAAPGEADRQGAEIAARRLSALSRGVNLSGWFGGWGEYTADHVATYTTPKDLAVIHASGLQYVRLCVDPVQFTAGGFDSPDSVAALARFDHSLDDILAAKLNVLVTVFPKSDYKQALLTAEGEEAYLGLWKFLAAHLAARDPERVFFDLMNEPEVKDTERWNQLQESVVEAVRAVDTEHTLIATGARYDGVDELLQVAPVHDGNVIYTFHFYEPYPFTHQGATWGSPEWPQLHGVPYPGEAGKVVLMIVAMADPAARTTLARYAGEGWDEGVILKRLSAARAWADANHVSILCNEFGAFRDTAPAVARARYLHDVRSALESLHIGWAEWDYRGNFGIVSHGPDGTIVPDAEIFRALGLSWSAAPTGAVTP